MAELTIPVVLVIGSYLGSLSHTLTGLDALRRRDLTIKALVVNETPNATVSMAETLSTLNRFAAPIPIVALPRSPPDGQQAFGEIASLL
jgi:dethiobiotin synthetase